MNDSSGKINQLREEQEECESKLEKERDIWAAEMFELIAEEDVMANHVINYIKYQQLYYKSALEEIEDVMNRINGLISKCFDAFFFTCSLSFPLSLDNFRNSTQFTRMIHLHRWHI